MTHLAKHIHNRHHFKSDSTLHVVTMISNPAQWNSRYRLARQFLEEMAATSHVQVHLVEVAHGDRHHELECASKLSLTTKSEIWLKENALNLGVQRLLPHDWRYVAWVDADIHFRDPNWALNTLHQLQTWQIVQPWQHALDLGPRGEVMRMSNSFGWLHQNGTPKRRNQPGDQYSYAHPGFAWAATRAFWEQAQGLLDIGILGSGDFHMAWAAIADAEWTVNPQLATSYHRRVKEWQDRVVRVTHKQVGYTPGRIEHSFHGSKKDRKYRSRWQLLIEHGYCPDTHLVRDEQGLYQLHQHPDLEQAVRIYNRSRNEDSIDP